MDMQIGRDEDDFMKAIDPLKGFQKIEKIARERRMFAIRILPFTEQVNGHDMA